MTRNIRSLGWLVLSLTLAAPAQAAIAINYRATDLADLTAGNDRWQYEYFLTGTFLSDFGFDVLFPIANGYDDGDLLSGTTLNPNWDLLLLQPNSSLPNDGRFDALALIDNAELSAPFVATFIWRGIGTPGAQPFELFDDGFQVIGTGTTSPVPLPPAFGLLAAGLLAARGLVRTRRHDNQEWSKRTDR